MASYFLLKLPKARLVKMIDQEKDAAGVKTGKTIEHKVYISGVTALNVAVLNATLLVQEGFDFFDVNDTRAIVKSAFDRLGNGSLDDEFIVLEEKQKDILKAAVKKHDWVLKTKDEAGNEIIDTFWLDWIDFFTSIKNISPFDPANPSSEYAEWKLAKIKRLEAYAEAEKVALEKAAKADEGDKA